MSGHLSDARAVVEAADCLVRQLRPAAEQDWTHRAGTLRLKVRDVIDHLVDVGVFYSLHLAARSAER